jgi:phospholipid/cholesterol/gamma-HCH transport system substrate-binding protein
MRIRAFLLAATLIVPALVMAGCSNDGDGKVHASATFPDVADLATGAPVMMSDITIGKVSGISLDRTGRRATVHFTVDKSAEVPADVQANVRRTSALGEKFIDLTPRSKAADRAGSPLLRDHAVIRHTGVISDLEQLVSSGTATFEALSASQIAVLLDEGSKAFGGKGPQLRRVLSDLSSVAGGYKTRTGEIKGIIDDLNQLSGDLAPKVDANGKALKNIDDSLAILNANDDRFMSLVRSLNRLADDGNRMLKNHLGQIHTQLRGLQDVTDAVATEQDSLAGVLRDLPKHNRDLPSAESGKFVQVLLDVILCGVPNGGDVPGDPVDECYAGSGS